MIWKSIELCTLLLMNTKGICIASDSNLKHENWSAGIKKIHNRHVILLWSKKEVDICSPNLNSMHKICIAHIPVHINKLYAVYSKIC